MTIDFTDHAVPHVSTVPANQGQTVELFMRERDGTPSSGLPNSRKAVLALNSRSVPVLAGFDLQYGTYSWADALAQAGFDVFMLDLQGSGMSPRPKVMDDPCNVGFSAGQDWTLLQPPLTGPCTTASYPFQLNNSHSDEDELATVVDYILNQLPVDELHFIAWSAAARVMVPYVIKNPTVVKSLFLMAPSFPPAGWRDPPAVLPMPGFPTLLLTKEGLAHTWDPEALLCADQREDGMVDVVWDAIMDNDPLGRTWGAGVDHYRNAVWWGLNKDTVAQSELGQDVPVCIVYGENDKLANTDPPDPSKPNTNFSVPALYDALPKVPDDHSVMIKVACAGHNMPWERQHTNLHDLSSEWLESQTVDGGRVSSGVHYMDENGVLDP
ncbi:alpha/beta fold hydrolase [Kitasatospora sp. NPDC093558]|uniref:alpha/beta fold hydrolase n=1 Tax=Kitasatospora sp. NPDC093558 TaxID=3155201 RepID=UPI00341D106F